MKNVYCYKHSQIRWFKCDICKSLKSLDAITIIKLGQALDKLEQLRRRK